MPSPPAGSPHRVSREPVGVVGLGSLGLPIARNLLAGGFDVVGFRRHPSPALAEAGGTAAASARDVAARCAIVVTCLPSAEALAEVVSGSRGLAQAATARTIVVELSTLPVAAKLEQQRVLASCGAAMLDCSVSGNQRYVADRTAALFASGERADFDRCSTMLAAITDRVSFVGAFGAGTTLKLIASLLVPVHTLAAAEALALAYRAGIDPAIAFDAIKGSQASSAMFETRGAAMVAQAYGGPPMADYHRRNVAPTLELADRMGGHYPLLHAMDACYRAAIDAGFGSLDQSGLFAYLRQRDDP
jgi:3-hydroxyisobutyrate dehydrogenase-like beta-hydroxyacid dehydrogenase